MINYERKEVYYMDFPMEEITSAIIAIVSYVLGLFTRKKKVK